MYHEPGQENLNVQFFLKLDIYFLFFLNLYYFLILVSKHTILTPYELIRQLSDIYSQYSISKVAFS